MNPARYLRRRVCLTILLVNAVILLYVLHGGPSQTANYADALQRATSTADSDASYPWTPLSLSSCLFGMPKHYAPCFAQQLDNVVYAEELLYPDFELRQPYFPTIHQRDLWRKFTQTNLEFQDRASLHGEWVSYKGQSGQNFVFRDVKYSRSFGEDIWSSRACMAKLVNTVNIRPLSKTESDEIFPTALIVTSPESFAFQHFLDRATHILIQGAHLYRDSDTYALTGRDGTRTVNEMWERMGFPPDHIVHQSKSIAAERMVFSCRAVLTHPWLSLKTLEALGLGNKPIPSPVQRKTVVYMSRSDGRASNRGRRVVNEEFVLFGIQSLLEERNLGEELVLFDPSVFQDATDLFSWFADNVLAVVGPHGGAMINHRWAHKDTFVLEFMPENRIAMMIYEEASLLSQTYAAIVVPPTTPDSFDMEIDVDQVLELLRAHLGVLSEEGPLRKSYSWPAKELGF
ncbi:hypothetical protein C8F01DRAFT_1021907 [Mycena amicta]|nr:hypothetical protein C8F01DRAFT_1021907 [Mycena amicta]